MISRGHNSSHLVWLRLDLRFTDNPALAAAVERSGGDAAPFSRIFNPVT
jgi:hypothetical protein